MNRVVDVDDMVSSAVTIPVEETRGITFRLLMQELALWNVHMQEVVESSNCEYR